MTYLQIQQDVWRRLGKGSSTETPPTLVIERVKEFVNQRYAELLDLIAWTGTSNTLTADGDTPVFPSRFHRALVFGACMDECAKMDDGRARWFEGEWQKTIAQVRYWAAVRTGDDWVPTGNYFKHSNLGPWFPSDY